jgi:MFS family permease
MNIATVFASTVMGGLMVEAGQAFGASGRISSLRQGVQSISQIIGPTLGGLLAAKMMFNKEFHPEWWTVTMVICAGAVLALAVLTVLVLREPRAPKPTLELVERPKIRIPPLMIGGVLAGSIIATLLYMTKDYWRIGISLYALAGMFLLIIILVKFPTRNATVVKAQGQLDHILDSRTLWMAVAMLFLVYTVPGFNTALTYRQEDVMKFGQGFIGNLGSVEGTLGVIAAAVYFAFCRKLNLRTLLIGGVGINALTTFLYLLYHPGTPTWAIIGIHATGGFWVVISELALMDLAVRSTPAGCEALGFALMMSVRNFGIALSDLLGSKMLDAKLVSFETMVVINACTTLVILLFIPFLPRIVMSRREGESMKPSDEDLEPEIT